jgi:hypothetical protein
MLQATSFMVWLPMIHNHPSTCNATQKLCTKISFVHHTRSEAPVVFPLSISPIAGKKWC